MDWKRFNGWVDRRASAALTDAYQRAMRIRAIEEKHFNGEKISPDHAGGKSVYEFFRGSLERELGQIRLDLSQVRLAGFFRAHEAVREAGSDTVQMLRSIEEVIGKYRPKLEESLFAFPSPPSAPSPAPEPNPSPPPESDPVPPHLTPPKLANFFQLRRGLSPEYERAVIQKLRVMRQQQGIAVRFLALSLLLPLLVQVVTKNLVFGPLLNYLEVDRTRLEELYVAEEAGERFLAEFSRLQEIREIRSILGVGKEPLEKAEEQFRERVLDLVKEAGYESQEGLKNLLSDLSALSAFTLVLVLGRRQLAITRTHISWYFLSLNDITKAFIFILFTDIFVGFHSAEGWTVLIQGISRHFGVRESETFIGLFVATVPVILDTIFKLLIFNYLTRKSPTAATILEKMNQ